MRRPGQRQVLRGLRRVTLAPDLSLVRPIGKAGRSVLRQLWIEPDGKHTATGDSAS